MQNFTYHCHTNFGGVFDGKNSAAEMIAQAEKLGFCEIGISNHLIYHPNQPMTIPMMFNDYQKAIDIYQKNIEDIRNAAKQAHIPVRVGFEVNYYPSVRWCSDFEKMRSQLDVDYWIGAVHDLCSSDGEEIINLYDVYWHNKAQNLSLIERYSPTMYDVVIQAIESHYFDIIAHLDIFKVFGLGIGKEWNAKKKQVIEKLAQHHQTFELNTSGWNKCGEQHPDKEMLIWANELNVPLLISDDAHSCQQLGQYFDRAESLLSEINYTPRVKLKF